MVQLSIPLFNSVFSPSIGLKLNFVKLLQLVQLMEGNFAELHRNNVKFYKEISQETLYLVFLYLLYLSKQHRKYPTLISVSHFQLKILLLIGKLFIRFTVCTYRYI